MTSGRRHRPAALALACACALGLGAAAAQAAPAAPAAGSCPLPAAGAEWTARDPATLGLDAIALQQAMQLATTDPDSTVAVYRHGCLAGTTSHAPAAREERFESWSTGKSVVSIAAGRAMTLGLLSPDDRVGALIPAADRAHGALTVRQLLQMAGGLHWNFFRDYSQDLDQNRVNDALTLGLDHAPGSWFEYDQSTVSLVTELVARAAGTDFQTFLQRELFGPIGIAPGTWSWTREHHHHTLGFMGLQLRPADYARIGQLMLDGGSWSGRQLIDADYVKAATTSSPSNPGYGWFWWLNAGARFIGPTGRARDVHDRRIVESAPSDMFTAAGLGDQLVMVIPSLDLVLTRESRVSRSRDAIRRDASTVSLGASDHDVVRELTKAVTDVHVPDAGPFAEHQAAPGPSGQYGIGTSLLDGADMAAVHVTPPLPPAGPSVARAAIVGGSGVHVRAIAVRLDRHGAATFAISCPPVASVACAGTVTLQRSGRSASAAVRYRAARGRRVHVTVTAGDALRRALAQRGRVSATLRVSSGAPAGTTVTKVSLALS